MRQLDAVTANDAGDRADVMSHTPALIASEIADRRVRLNVVYNLEHIEIGY